jgi:hypothetical protein
MMQIAMSWDEQLWPLYEGLALSGRVNTMLGVHAFLTALAE